MNEIIIGWKPLSEYLYVLFKLPDSINEVVIKYVDRHENAAALLIDGLKKFGWSPGKIEKYETFPDVCVYNVDNKCIKIDSGYEKCSFYTRKFCSNYKQNKENKIIVNQITIQKHGALR